MYSSKNNRHTFHKTLRFLTTTTFFFFAFVLGIRSQTIEYSFFVAGHTYGKPGVNNVGLHPPFKEKFDYIRSREEIKFGILTGDIVISSTKQNWDEVDADIDSLGLPVYFAVGNHSANNRQLIRDRYGDTYFSFTYDNDLFIILDPNIDKWNISGEQLDFLKTTLAENSENVDNIFVFFHQLLWWKKDNKYAHLRPNSFDGRADSINFWSEVEPLFSKLKNQVGMFAGDVGAADWSDDFMYDRYGNITLIASGMGEGKGDNFVVANVHSDKSVTYELICLSDTILNCFGDITDYRITSQAEPGETDTENVKIFPNPSRGEFTVEGSAVRNADYTFSLFDFTGAKVVEKQMHGNSTSEFNRNMENGIYFYRIKKGPEIVDSGKLIVQP